MSPQGLATSLHVLLQMAVELVARGHQILVTSLTGRRFNLHLTLRQRLGMKPTLLGKLVVSQIISAALISK